MNKVWKTEDKVKDVTERACGIMQQMLDDADKPTKVEIVGDFNCRKVVGTEERMQNISHMATMDYHNGFMRNLLTVESVALGVIAVVGIAHIVMTIIGG